VMARLFDAGDGWRINWKTDELNSHCLEVLEEPNIH
jgi:hypothetical protein